ncbi:MAG TPA: DNA replication and repair protein RecF [Actinomycetota bacterium]|nr:DNA replication and repair protein RecF [Actinomycetota bacterium]
MRLSWAELRDFRNHAASRLDDVAEGLVVAVGPNGEGKSNLLEGIAFLFLLASPRTSSTEPLVRRGAEAAYVRGEVQAVGGRVLVEVEIPGRGANRVQVNRSPVRRKRDLRRQVRAVYFGPDDLVVVIGEPSRRREFMDESIRALWPVKESTITAFDRVLRQRNRLLKDWGGRGLPTGLEAWDGELVETGCALMRLRAEAVRRIAPAAEEEYEHLAGYGLVCEYAPNVTGEGLEGSFEERLRQRREDELVRRTTLVGPHRDDLALAVRDLGARSFASHGEGWAAALCLRLGLGEAVRVEVGERPVLILDDPFSALDPRRQRLVAERLTGRGQVLVSVADEAHVPAGAASVWDVRGGSVTVREVA